MAADNQTAMTCRNVTKTFRAGGRSLVAVKDLTVEIRHGKITGLIGPDGAGKTTLMRLAAGLLARTAGPSMCWGSTRLGKRFRCKPA